MKALRIFYKESKSIWTHGLEGSGEFPTEIDEDLEELPSGTKCLTITEEDEITAFMASDANKIVDDRLIIGEPRPEPTEIPPEPVRDPLLEIDGLKANYDNLKAKVDILEKE